jgi:hypothetical protein
MAAFFYETANSKRTDANPAVEFERLHLRLQMRGQSLGKERRRVVEGAVLGARIIPSSPVPSGLLDDSSITPAAVSRMIMLAVVIRRVDLFGFGGFWGVIGYAKGFWLECIGGG